MHLTSKLPLHFFISAHSPNHVFHFKQLLLALIISIEGDGIVTYLTFLLWITVIAVLYWGCQVQAGDCCQWGSLSSP